MSDIDAIEARNKARRQGSWFWNVNRTSKCMSLESSNRGRETVMAFARWGMSSAQIILTEMRDGKHSGCLTKGVEYCAPFHGREHHENWLADIAHPDAQFIAHAPDDITFLLTELRALRELVSEEEQAHSSIASICFARGAEAGDGTSVSAVESLAKMCDALRERLARIDLYAGERCESDSAECGPVEFSDSDGVPLCAVCWEGLTEDTRGIE